MCLTKDEKIEAIISAEFNMFGRVQNRGGRADCQDDFPTFHIMRSAQFHAWNEASIDAYAADVREAERTGRNLPMLKYAYMMEYTVPDEYAEIRDRLPVVSDEKKALIAEIVPVMMRQTDAFMKKYPGFTAATRPVRADGAAGYASIETYLTGELKTYSGETLRRYRDWLLSEDAAGRSVVEKIYENTAAEYGYDSAAAAEAALQRRSRNE